VRLVFLFAMLALQAPPYITVPPEICPANCVCTVDHGVRTSMNCRYIPTSADVPAIWHWSEWMPWARQSYPTASECANGKPQGMADGTVNRWNNDRCEYRFHRYGCADKSRHLEEFTADGKRWCSESSQRAR